MIDLEERPIEDPEKFEMIHYGFTGTRKGMTEAQRERLRELWHPDGYPITLHHGDCIGSDKQAHQMALDTGWLVHVHPPLNGVYRAFCEGHYLEEKKDYLDRNRDIVDCSSVLFATPGRSSQKGGTWYTIRYAKKRGVLTFIILPDGTYGDL